MTSNDPKDRMFITLLTPADQAGWCGVLLALTWNFGKLTDMVSTKEGLEIRDDI